MSHVKQVQVCTCCKHHSPPAIRKEKEKKKRERQPYTLTCDVRSLPRAHGWEHLLLENLWTPIVIGNDVLKKRLPKRLKGQDHVLIPPAKSKMLRMFSLELFLKVQAKVKHMKTSHISS